MKGHRARSKKEWGATTGDSHFQPWFGQACGTRCLQRREYCRRRETR